MRLIVVVLSSFLLLTGCSVNHTGLADGTVFKAVPDTICPGDSSEIIWDIPATQSSDYCDASRGSSGMLCRIDSDCESDERCLDGRCLGADDDIQETDFGDGCPIDGNLNVNALIAETSEVSTVFSSDRVRGREAVSPESTTLYTGLYDVDGTRIATKFANVTVLGAEDFIETLDFGTPTCRTAGDARNVRLGESLGVFDPSTSIQLSRVINRSGVRVILRSSDPSNPPVFLNAGEASNAFNGPVPRAWTIQLDPLEVPLATSCTLDTGDFEPVPMSVELVVSCN